MSTDTDTTNDEKNIPPVPKRTVHWRDFFSGNVLKSHHLYKQRWYILLLFGLSVLYITNRAWADRVVRTNKQLKRELSVKQEEYVLKSSELMRLGRRSQILEQISKRNIDLHESTTPPKRVSSK